MAAMAAHYISESLFVAACREAAPPHLPFAARRGWPTVSDAASRSAEASPPAPSSGDTSGGAVGGSVADQLAQKRQHCHDHANNTLKNAVLGITAADCDSELGVRDANLDSGDANLDTGGLNRGAGGASAGAHKEEVCWMQADQLPVALPTTGTWELRDEGGEKGGVHPHSNSRYQSYR